MSASAQADLIEIDDSLDIISNTAPFQCPMCKDFVSGAEGIVLRDCLHIFCLQCVAEYIINNNTGLGVLIKCLHVEIPGSSTTAGCYGVFQEKEVRYFLNSYEVRPRRKKRRLADESSQSKNTKAKYIVFNCLTDGCTGWCLRKHKMKQFHCTVCKNVNCLSCKAIHEFKTCDDYIKSKRHSYDDLVKLDALMDIVANTEPFSCAICFEDYGIGEGMTLRECLHTFCRTCIKNHILYSTDVEIRCPYMDVQYTCECFLQEREIKNSITDEEYSKYLTRSLQVAEQRIENTFHCLTPNCLGWCVVENNAVQFICCICRKDNCLSCKVIHEGKTCDEYLLSTTKYKITDAVKLSEKVLNKMIKSGKAMLCPTCQAVIEKISGCDGMQCIACKTLLCWATRGPRWGPAGKGDTSGGCQCGVNGKKCHKSCKNCH